MLLTERNFPTIMYFDFLMVTWRIFIFNNYSFGLYVLLADVVVFYWRLLVCLALHWQQLTHVEGTTTSRREACNFRGPPCPEPLRALAPPHGQTTRGKSNFCVWPPSLKSGANSELSLALFLLWLHRDDHYDPPFRKHTARERVRKSPGAACCSRAVRNLN